MEMEFVVMSSAPGVRVISINSIIVNIEVNEYEPIVAIQEVDVNIKYERVYKKINLKVALLESSNVVRVVFYNPTRSQILGKC